MDACGLAGSRLAQDGASRDDALEALNRTVLAVSGSEPAFADVRALSMAWSESTPAYLYQLSCEDPLTGLASLAHIRSRPSALYRGAPPADDTHTRVVHDLPTDPAGGATFHRTQEPR